MESTIVTYLPNVNTDWQDEQSDLLIKIDRELRKILEGQLLPENKHQQLKSTSIKFKASRRHTGIGANGSSSRDSPKEERIPLGTDSANVTSRDVGAVDNSNRDLLNAKFHEALLDIFRRDIGSAKQSNKLGTSGVRFPLNIKLLNSTKLKNIDQTLVKSIHRETCLLLRQKQLIPSKKQSINQHLEVSKEEKLQHNFGHVKVISAPTESHGYLRCNNSGANAMDLDAWCPNKRFTIEYFSLRLKLRKLKRMKGLNLTVPAQSHIKTSAIGVSKPYKFIDKIICTLKAKFLPHTATDALNTIVSKPTESSIPNKTIQSTAIIGSSSTSAHISIPVYRKVVKKMLPVNRKPMISQPARAKPTSRSLKYKNTFSLKFTNYQELNCSKTDLTIDQFARCLNLVKIDSLPLKTQQFQSKLIDIAAISAKNIRLRLKLQ